MKDRDSKLITKNQQLGIETQNQFAAFAPSVGLIPNRCIEDYGFDFVCQVQGKELDKKTNIMEGRFIAVSVRSTANKGNPKIQIDRKDARLFLSCDSPFILVLVTKHPRGSFSFHIRFPEPPFLSQLISFLHSDRENMGISVKDCISSLKVIKEKIAIIKSPEFSERMRHSIRELRISNILPASHLRILTQTNGSMSIIELENFDDMFDISSEIAEKQLIKAAFGREDLLPKRLKPLKMKTGLLDASKDLPGPVLFRVPAFTTGKGMLTCINGTDRASCSFECRRTKTHHGYYHGSGVSLIISEARKHKGRYVHWCDCEIDAEANTLIKNHPDICEFLNLCTDGGKVQIGEDSDHLIPTSAFRNLQALGYLVSYLKNIPDSKEIRLSDWKFEIVEEEDLQTLRILSTLYTKKSALDGWGFQLDGWKEDDYELQEKRFTIPLCMNLKKKGFACWLEVNGIFLIDKSSNALIGLKIDNTIDFYLEKSERAFPTSGFPEFKLSPEWPSICLYLNEQSSRFLREDWGVQMGGRFS